MRRFRHSISRKFFLPFFCILLFWMGCAGTVFNQSVNAGEPLDNASHPTLAEMAGQMILCGFRGDTAAECVRVIHDVQDGFVGGLIFFSRDVSLNAEHRNITSPRQLMELTAELQHYAKIPLLLAIDQEGGRVVRLSPIRGFQPTASAEQLGAAGSLLKIEEAGKRIGDEMLSVGLNLNFAPVVDLNVNPENPAIGLLGRSFGADPGTVTMMGQAFIRGLHQGGIISCLKHFPGHGSAFNDSHKGLTDVTGTWKESELQPFRDLIMSGDCDMVMTAHVFNARLDPQYPASLSYKTVTKLLREHLGCDKVIITDDLQMKAISNEYSLTEAAVLAIEAGVDIVLAGNNLNYNPDAAVLIHAALMKRAGESPEFRQRIIKSYHRIMTLKSRLPQRLQPHP